jgi:hypothetical protein
MNWTEEQFAEYQAKRRPSIPETKPDLPPTIDDQPERALQDRIEGWCRENGFYAFHDRSRKCNQPGHPDLVIALRDGRVLWLELKARGGRLRPEQAMIGKLLTFCGHEWHCVRSWKRFMEIVTEGKGEQ